MKPVFPIFLALITSFFLVIGIDVLTNTVDVNLAIFTYLIYVLGGILATGLSKEYKIRYGLYYGLITAIIIGGFFKIPLIAPLIIILGTFGGFIAAMISQKYRLSFFNRYEFNFTPLITIIVGVVITSLCYILLISLAVVSYGIASANVYGTLFLFGGISLILGSFVSTFLTKDKKIQYGIYSGIIFIIFKFLVEMTNINVVQGHYYIIITSTIGYLFFAITGSYLATNKIKIRE